MLIRLIGLLLSILFFTPDVKSQQPTLRNKAIHFESSIELLSHWDSLYAEGGQFFTELNPNEWLDYVTDFREKAENEENEKRVVVLDGIWGNILFAQSKYKEAIPILSSVLEKRETIEDAYLSRVLVQLEESYRRTGNLKEAIPLRKERIELGLDQDFFEIYEEAGLFQEAIVEYTQHNPFPKAPLSRLGYHARVGRLHNQNNQLDSAIYHYEKAFFYGYPTLNAEDYMGKNPSSDFRKKFWTHEMRGEIGLIYVKQQRYQKAIPLLKKIVAVGKEINELALIIPKRLGLVECYLNLNELTFAEQELDTVRLATQEMDWFVHKIKYQQVLGEYFYKKGIFDSAAIAFKTHNQLKDSIQKIQNQNKLIATTAFLDNERQGKLLAEQRLELINAENDSIQKTNQLYWLIFAIIGSLGIIGFLFLDTRRKQKAKEKAETDRDVIEQQSLKIKELDKVKTRFFSNISHEFRTPLTLIQGPLESVMEGRTRKKETADNLKVAHRNIGTLRRLIDEILDFNKMEQGELQLITKAIFLKSFVEERVEGYELLAKEKGIFFQTSHYFNDSLSVEAVPDKLENVLNNLISNAIKHSPEDSVVTLDLKIEKGLLKGSVNDQGPGIAPEELDKIFERFYQSTHGKLIPHSSGIGLAYVKEIISALGGAIYVASELHVGTTFNFEIPVKELKLAEGAEEPEEDSSINLAPYSHGNNKILLVEDNVEMADYLQQVLGKEFEITKSANGLEALERLKKEEPDLIITDLMMPKMGGLELISELKKNEHWKRKSVIVLSAKTSHETKIEALSFGLDDYITKPFSPTELEARVKNLLNNQHERSRWLVENGEEQESKQNIDPLIVALKEFIVENINGSQLGVSQLAEKIALSERQLTRLVKKSTGLTPALFIREVKLKIAKEQLESKKVRSVAQAAYAVGFEKPSHFSTLFINRFGKKPSEYLN